MSKFKVGDKVLFIEDSRGQCYKYGEYGLQKDVVYILVYGNNNWFINTGSNNVYFADSTLEYNLKLEGEYADYALPDGAMIIKNKTNKTIMTNLIKTFKNITRSEPNKSFVKAGVMNEDLSLTVEGKELFIQYMFEQNAGKFKLDVVDAILAEEKSKD